MDILGIGFSELIFILIIALMVFGPRRLPEMAAKAGKFIGDLRNMSQGLMNEWQREISASAHLEELEKSRQEMIKAKEELQQAGKSVSTETGSVAKALRPPENSVLRPIVQMPPKDDQEPESPEPEEQPEQAQTDDQPVQEATQAGMESPDSPKKSTTPTPPPHENPPGEPNGQIHANGGDAAALNKVSPATSKDSEKVVNE